MWCRVDGLNTENIVTDNHKHDNLKLRFRAIAATLSLLTLSGSKSDKIFNNALASKLSG